MTELATQKCKPCEGGIPPLDLAAAVKLRDQLRPEWSLVREGKAIQARFEFRNYFRTLAFVNAVAYIAIQEDHHPDITFGYKSCTILYETHAIGGLSDNDFICAAKIDLLLGASPST